MEETEHKNINDRISTCPLLQLLGITFQLTMSLCISDICYCPMRLCERFAPLLIGSLKKLVWHRDN